MSVVSGSSRQRFIGLGAAAFASGVISGPVGAAQFEFKCANNQPPDTPLNVRAVQMWAAIEQESGGRIHTQMYPQSQLGGDAAMFSQLRLGALQFFQLTTGNLSSVAPASDIASLGFAFKDEDEALRAMDGPLGAYIRDQSATKGVHVLRSIWNSGMLQVSSNSHPIRTPDDLHGFKLRVTESRILLELFRGLGASPTILSTSELYTAMQTKIVDGQTCPLGAFDSAKFYEVQKYLSITNEAWIGEWMIANGEVWKSLPPDLQEIVERNNTKYAMLERTDTKAINSVLVTKLAGRGMTVNRVDQTPFRSSLHSYYETWASAFGATEWNLLQNALGRKLT